MALPMQWDAVFRGLAMGATIALALVAIVIRHRGDYLGRFVHWAERVTGRPLGARRVVRFLVDVEHVLLALLRGDRRRLEGACARRAEIAWLVLQ